MRAFTSLLCISALVATNISAVTSAGFADLLGPLLGSDRESGGGVLSSILGPVSVVSGDFVGVDTRVGSPTTVIDKGVTPKEGLSLKGPTFVRVKTDIDAEATEIRTGPAKSPPAASPAPPAVADPEIALALSKPRPSSVSAVTTALASIADSIFGRAPATPAPAPTSPAPSPPLTSQAAASSTASTSATAHATATATTADTRPIAVRKADPGASDLESKPATPTPQTKPVPAAGAVSSPDTASRSLRG